MNIVTITTPEERRIIDNIEAEISCPNCGDRNCSEMEQRQVVSVTPVWICKECGQTGYYHEFKGVEVQNVETRIVQEL